MEDFTNKLLKGMVPGVGMLSSSWLGDAKSWDRFEG
jgi:hypothetical protein